MGVWKGQFEEAGEWHDMEIKTFKVKDSAISGGGKDASGKFEFIGLYNAEGAVHFVKQYKGAHQIEYKGRREGQFIEGEWSFQGNSGPFKIWKQRKWEGTFSQGGQHHPMHFQTLKFRKGQVSGSGEDDNGKFVIDGTIGDHGDIEFKKQYIGKHAVLYKGTRTYHLIKGHWSIPDFGLHDEFELKVGADYDHFLIESG